MAYAFGKSSTRRLRTCHEDIQAVMTLALEKSNHDFSIAEGYRGQEKQDRCVKEGTSWVLYPGSYHNSEPSLAVDVVPFKGKAIWDDETYEDAMAWAEVVTSIKEAADELGVKLDHGFALWKKDKPHFQLTEHRK